MNILQISYVLLGLSVVGAFVYWASVTARKKYIRQTLKLKPLLVKLSQKKSEPGKDDPLKEIMLSGQLLSGLSNLGIPFSLETAVHNIGEEIHFYVGVPRDSIQFVSQQITGLWSDATVEEVEEYNIFNREGVSQGVYLKQKEAAVLPIRTFEEAQLDTFLPILNDFSKIQAMGEGVAIQAIIKPAPKSILKAISSAIYQLKRGKKFDEALNQNNFITLKDVKKALFPEKKKENEPKPVLEEETIKALEKKISKQLFSVNYRVLISAPNQMRADELIQIFTGSFDQFTAPRRNTLKAVRPRNQKEFIFQYIFRMFESSQNMLLGTDEMTSLFHFPTSATEIPRLKWLKSKESQPPTIMPKEGTLLGESRFRGERRPVMISDEDRRRHLYIIGQTGTGKTNLIVNLAVSDILKGKGVAVIDPHGDLIDSILGLIPQNRINDVIVFDPGDIMMPLGLNMLEYDFSHPEQKTFISNEMLEIFRKLFPESGEALGPVFQQYMRNTIQLLMEDAPNEPATLMDVPRLLTDEEFRNAKLARCQNPVVRDFWVREVAAVSGEASLSNIAPYITSKFNTFLANDYVRPIINQHKSAFSFREIMDSQKILLVNLSKGRIGNINADLLGMILVGKMLMSALSRVDIPQEERKDFNLYIDEFQNVTTDSISTILSEARKYRLNLVIAHQFIAQLQDKIRDAVFGNVGSMVMFRVGSEDAEKLVKQVEPVFSQNDLISIDNFNAFVKLLIDGQPARPFNMRVLPAPKGENAVRDRIKEISRQKYGKPRH